MSYVNENLKNWLLGKSEIDNMCSAIPPAQDNPEHLLELYKQAKSNDKDKIAKKLDKLGYEVKILYILSRK